MWWLWTIIVSSIYPKTRGKTPIRARMLEFAPNLAKHNTSTRVDLKYSIPIPHHHPQFETVAFYRQSGEIIHQIFFHSEILREIFSVCVFASTNV